MRKNDKLIRNAGFSVRLTNALAAAGIKTVYKALNMPISKLKRIPNLGDACVNELYNYAKEHNLLHTHQYDKQIKETAHESN